jgi:hypothetical protein
MQQSNRDRTGRSKLKEKNMSRLKAIHPSTATGKAKELLDAVKGKLGLVPNYDQGDG